MKKGKSMLLIIGTLAVAVIVVVAVDAFKQTRGR